MLLLGRVDVLPVMMLWLQLLVFVHQTTTQIFLQLTAGLCKTISGDASFALSGLTSSYQAASDMRIWDCADTVQYGIKSCTSHPVSQVVTAMVKACAFADSHNSYWVKSVSDEVEVLRQLRDLGHVSCGQQVGDSVPWVLTRYGARSVLTEKPLLDFVRVAYPREIPVVDQTRFEILSAMLDNGWDLQCKPIAEAKALTYTYGGPKLFFTPGLTLQKPYLLALLKAESTEGSELQHGMSAGYYTAFLTGKARRQHLAIADDDLAPDEGVERAAASAYDADKEEENLLDIEFGRGFGGGISWQRQESRTRGGHQ